MSQINVFKEAMGLAERRANIRVRHRLINADQFEIDLWVFHVPGEGKFHTCGRDEFFYMLKGEMELQIEDAVYLLRKGEGINVPARIKYKYKAKCDTWVLVTSKWPHEHIDYDTPHAL